LGAKLRSLSAKKLGPAELAELTELGRRQRALTVEAAREAAGLVGAGPKPVDALLRTIEQTLGTEAPAGRSASRVSGAAAGLDKHQCANLWSPPRFAA